MKNYGKFLILLMALSVVMCMTVFAADATTIDTITDLAANTTATAYEDQVNFNLTYSAAKENGMYLVLVLKGDAVLPDKDNILYVNQATAEGTTVNFTAEKNGVVYPTAIEDSTIVLAGAGLDAGPIKLGKIVANKPAFTVTAVGSKNQPAYALSGDGKTLTVQFATACVVGYSTDGGATYTALTATANAVNGYDYSLTSVPAGASIVVAVKGDMSGDGNIRAGDATQILKAAGGEAITAVQKLVADLDANGKVRAGEATQVLKAAGGAAALEW